MERLPPPTPPPPHPRRSLMGGVVDHHSTAPSKKGGKTSMGGRAYYFRRCKKVPASNIESLPDEMLSEILVRLSADELCERARFVCRKWYYIIHSDAFISAQRANSNWGLLLTSDFMYRAQPLFLGVREGRIEISKFNPEHYLPVQASCNGLVLWMKYSKFLDVRIVNLATKQQFSLPSTDPLIEIYMSTFGIAYAAASMEYKVVRTQEPFEGGPTRCDIVTAGIDSDWRCVGIDSLSDVAKQILLGVPLITEGFMHWTWYHKETHIQGTHILSLNVETEMFTESHAPLRDEDGDGGNQLFYLSAGSRLTLLSGCRDLMWQLWEMDGESGEWRKMVPNIDMKAHMSRVEQELVLPDGCTRYLVPLGWVKYPVLLVFSCESLGCTCILYNLDTDEIETFKLPRSFSNYKAVVHRNTLEWLST